MKAAAIAVKHPKYEISRTSTGTWKRYYHLNGRKFCEFKSHLSIFGRPLVSVAGGLCPETGKMVTAKGIVAVGQRAKGVIAIGQFSNGYFAVGQFAVGRVAAVGQFAVAPLAIGQFAIAVAAIGQAGIAGWGIFQNAITIFGGIGASIWNLYEMIPSVF